MLQRIQHPEAAEQIGKLKDIETSFTFILENVSGNSHSFIENLQYFNPSFVNASSANNNVFCSNF